MRKKLWSTFVHRGSPFWFALGISLLFGGSTFLISYIFGIIAILVFGGILLYNWWHPSDDYMPTIPEAIRDSKLVWGFWHSGERAKLSFGYGTVKRVLLVEPIPGSTAITHRLNEASANKKDLVQNINLTKARAIEKGIEVRWHNEITSLSFMICDPSPNIDNDVVTFSNRAYVMVQVLDRNLDREDWSLYKKTMAKDKYAFNGYVSWFKEVWDNRSKSITSK